MGSVFAVSLNLTYQSAYAGSSRVFLTLVYHDLVPAVCDRLEYDAPRIRAALLLGSAAPLLLFLGWEAVALALTAGLEGEFDPVGFIRQSSGGVADAINVFSAAALSTSVIGTCVAAKQYVANEVRHARMGDLDDGGWAELAVLLLVLLPGTKTAIDNPNLFLAASKFAGAYGSSCLYGLLPPLMALKLGMGGGEDGRGVGAYAPGGALTCVVLVAAAAGIALLH